VGVGVTGGVGVGVHGGPIPLHQVMCRVSTRQPSLPAKPPRPLNVWYVHNGCDEAA
jgi:hypothetical protein